MASISCVCLGEGDIQCVAIRDADMTYRIFEQRCQCDGGRGGQDGALSGEKVLCASQLKEYLDQGYQLRTSAKSKAINVKHAAAT